MALPGPATVAGRTPCGLGTIESERVVLRPRSGTFYSVDVLNPDVVRFRDRYFLFFSGNSVRHDAGVWQTGLATSRSPGGPYSVEQRVSANFYNGGTATVAGRLIHGANVNGRREPFLFTSRNGRRWRVIGRMPTPTGPSWRFLQSDLYLRARGRGVDVYFAGRPAAEGADLGVARYVSGRWRNVSIILKRDLRRWDGADLGEPAVFGVGGRRYMLYVGMAERTLQAGRLAYQAGRRWLPCSDRPLIPIGGQFAPKNAIDPEPLVVGDRLFLFYGAGRTDSQGGNMNGRIVVRTYRLP